MTVALTGIGLVCPRCGGRTAVTDSRPAPGYIRRRRQCGCGYRFSTAEVPFEGIGEADGKSKIMAMIRFQMSIERLSPTNRETIERLIAAFGEEKDTA